MCKLLIVVYLYSLCNILVWINLDMDANLIMQNISWKTVTIYTLRMWTMAASLSFGLVFATWEKKILIFKLIWASVMVGTMFRNLSTNNMSGSIDIDLISTSPEFELGILDLSSNNFSNYISNFSRFSTAFQQLWVFLSLPIK